MKAKMTEENKIGYLEDFLQMRHKVRLKKIRSIRRCIKNHRIDYFQQWEYIEEVAVVGLLNPHDNSECPVAFVTTINDFNYSAFKDFLVTNLSSLKLPHYVAKTSAPLPRNRNGKVNKLLLQDQALTLLKTNQLYSL